ncbi:hypothetical protein PanWU01x14_284020, partial [Parasponia andersonii]
IGALPICKVYIALSQFFSLDLHHLTSREVLHLSLAMNAHIARSPVALKCPDCYPQLASGIKNL